MGALVGALAAVASACAHYDPKRGGPAPRRSEHMISMEQGSSPLKALEQELATVRSDRVIVSTTLLRALVRNERIQQNQCKSAIGQLEALKNIDFEETGPREELQ